MWKVPQPDDPDSWFDPNIPEYWSQIEKKHYDGRVLFPWMPQSPSQEGNTAFFTDDARKHPILRKLIPSRQLPQPVYIEAEAVHEILEAEGMSMAILDESLGRCMEALYRDAARSFYDVRMPEIQPEPQDVLDINYYMALTYLRVVAQEMREAPAGRCHLPVWGEGRFSAAIDVLPDILEDCRLNDYIEREYGEQGLATVKHVIQVFAGAIAEHAIGSDPLSADEEAIPVMADPFATGSVVPGEMNALHDTQGELSDWRDFINTLDLDKL